MAEFNRRKFLIAGVGAGAAGLLGGAAAIGWHELKQAADRQPLAEGTGVLVIITLYGGNDGLSTVVPYTDPVYYSKRPDLAYAPQDVIRLDERLGLNPGLQGLSKVWGERKLAIVNGVSYPKPDRSHFRSMDIWQTASPSEPVSSGWIGRWLDATGDDPLRALNLGAVLPLLVVGEKHTASALTGNRSPVSEQLNPVLLALGGEDRHDTPQMAAISAAYRATHDVGTTLAPALGTGSPTTTFDPNAGGLNFTAGAGKNPLADRLKTVGTCIKARVPTRVYTLTLGGFDTHADERGTQRDLLTVLDTALTPFLADMSADLYGKNVVVMVYSEFGRRVAANASQGTDHGTAGPVLIAGGPVKGGFYGEQPSLTDLDDGDLKGTVDFRDVYQDLLVNVLKADPEPSVGKGRREIGFM
ncbi:Uncharacterized protein conserved in bacteria [Mycobacteroides abscessus subsp. abscessus]|nr:Uncharacterized protein conserved in bacteria [Mycobacteroides abscessus subsp. abscessus]